MSTGYDDTRQGGDMTPIAVRDISHLIARSHESSSADWRDVSLREIETAVASHHRQPQGEAMTLHDITATRYPGTEWTPWQTVYECACGTDIGFDEQGAGGGLDVDDAFEAHLADVAEQDGADCGDTA